MHSKKKNEASNDLIDFSIWMSFSPRDLVHRSDTARLKKKSAFLPWGLLRLYSELASFLLIFVECCRNLPSLFSISSYVSCIRRTWRAESDFSDSRHLSLGCSGVRTGGGVQRYVVTPPPQYLKKFFKLTKRHLPSSQTSFKKFMIFRDLQDVLLLIFTYKKRASFFF